MDGLTIRKDIGASSSRRMERDLFAVTSMQAVLWEDRATWKKLSQRTPYRDVREQLVEETKNYAK